jgi:branched-chain amino acid transport system substrate-binding protein
MYPLRVRKEPSMTRRYARVAAGLVVAAVLVTTALAGCSQKPADETGDATGAATTTVRIGFAAPLTGDNAIYGQGMKRAVEMAIAEANDSAEAKAAGYEFVLAAQDDQADPKQAVNVANLLVGDTGVVAVVGHFNSGCSIPASPVYDRADMAMVSVSSNPQLTAQGFVTVNRIVAKDDAQGGAAAELAYGTLGFRKVVVIDDSTPYGEGLATEFIKGFEAAGGQVLATEKIQAKEVDFSALMTRFGAVDPDAIYYGGAHTEGALISKQAKAAGLTVPVVGGDMLFSADYVSIAGATNAEGDLCTSLGLPLEQQPRGVDFKNAYLERFGQEPEAYDSYAYDSAWIIINAVLEAGTDRVAVAEAIRSLSYEGVTGTVDFDDAGDTKNAAISTYKVVGGAWEQLSR